MTLYLAIPIGIAAALLALAFIASCKFHRDFNRNGGVLIAAAFSDKAHSHKMLPAFAPGAPSSSVRGTGDET